MNVTVVMPAYNEEDSVGNVVSGFLEHPDVDEVIVADNNSEDRTAEKARENGAKVIEEKEQGYGYAMRTAMANSDTDITVTTESDATYDPDDLDKLLAYAEDFDVVLGDRTNRAMLEENAKMGPFLRYGNKFLGRMIQVLFRTHRLTDVGCSYRLFHREPLEKILSKDVAGADRFSPQIIIELIREDFSFIQVPVKYLERTGESKLTADFRSSATIGLDMSIYILKEALHRG